MTPSLSFIYETTKSFFLWYVSEEGVTFFCCIIFSADYGHPERAFFQKSRTFGLGQTSWAEMFLRHLGYFWSDYQYPFWYCDILVKVFHYSTIISTKTKPLYPTPNYLFGSGIWIWAAKNLIFSLRVSVVRDHFHHVILMHSVLQIWGTKNYASFFAYTVYVHIHTSTYIERGPSMFLQKEAFWGLPSNVQIFWEGHKILLTLPSKFKKLGNVFKLLWLSQNIRTLHMLLYRKL